MAYGKKYYHDYCNSFGVACEVAIYEEDYLGAAIFVEAQAVPFIKEATTNSAFKFEAIRPSVGQVNLVFEDGGVIDFEEFWTADELKFQVHHTINSQLDWIGYVIPDGFSYELKGGYYYGVLNASDGLNTLKDIPFSFSDNVPYGTQDLVYNNGFEFPWILIATEILKKLNLTLNTWTCIDVYERTMVKTGDTRNADPMSSSLVNVKTYINDTSRNDIAYWEDVNEVMNCDKVLKNLCTEFGAKVYQSKGVWRIKRINADADYGTGVTQRYWRKYNTAAVYLGREEINDDFFVPCATVAAAMIGNDHLLYMDDVYSSFRIDYEYTFIRDGDNPVNLIQNPNFVWTQTAKFGAPANWFRYGELRTSPKLRIKAVVPLLTDVGGIGSAIEIGTQNPSFPDGQARNDAEVAKAFRTLRYANTIAVTKGDRLFFSIWQKSQKIFTSPYANYSNGIYRMVLITAAGNKWFLRNNPTNAEHGLKYLDWIEDDKLDGEVNDIFFWLRRGVGQAENDTDVAQSLNVWRNYKMIIAALPESGSIFFDVLGLGSRTSPTSSTNRALKVYEASGKILIPVNYGPVRIEQFDGNADYMQVTGVELGRIAEPSEQPESQDYVYENQSGRYTLQVDPLTVLNGDTQDTDHISNIIVPTNTGTGKNFWDTIDNKYGGSSLGLITCKSIMNLYFKPFRLLDGDIKAAGATMDSRFTFEALPGRNFMLQSATFNEKQNYIEGASFYEISAAPIEQGGREGVNALFPVWYGTGNFDCEKDINNLNTGTVRYEEIDVNPNSETFGQLQWILGPVELATCPIGEPRGFYWGTTGLILDVDELTWFPLLSSVDAGKLVVQLSYSNSGGEYIYFVHLASRGLVESIFTTIQDEIISDFQYLADITKDGYLYKVLRQNYVTAQFNSVTINYKFS
jgi:hypothetical protein